MTWTTTPVYEPIVAEPIAAQDMRVKQAEMNAWFKAEPDMMAVKEWTPILPAVDKWPIDPRIYAGVDLASGPDKTVEWVKNTDGSITVINNTDKPAIVTTADLNRIKNKVPTHDPYTNPDATIYYECLCGAILDPGTKSFAALNNSAMNEGWKIRWKANGEGYQPHCVECGKGIEE